MAVTGDGAREDRMTDTSAHIVEIHATPTSGPPAHSIPFTFTASCSCRGIELSHNAIKWTLLAIQEHYTEVGMTGAKGNLVDGHPLLGQIQEALYQLDQVGPVVAGAPAPDVAARVNAARYALRTVVGGG
jgi:hypothetical protein